MKYWLFMCVVMLAVLHQFMWCIYPNICGCQPVHIPWDGPLCLMWIPSNLSLLEHDNDILSWEQKSDFELTQDIPLMVKAWLHGLCGLRGPRCPLSPKRPLNLITHSLEAWIIMCFLGKMARKCQQCAVLDVDVSLMYCISGKSYSYKH